MCLVKIDSNKRIHPRILAPKFKYQKFDKQNMTGKNILRKKVCGWWIIEHMGKVVGSSYGISGVW